MAPAGVYDDIAGWYEEEFLGGQRTEARARGGNPLDLGHVLRDLLGEGSGRLPGGRVRHRCPRRPERGVNVPCRARSGPSGHPEELAGPPPPRLGSGPGGGGCSRRHDQWRSTARFTASARLCHRCHASATCQRGDLGRVV
jgi:hypothetical protein